MNRENIDKKYTWNLNAIYSSIDDFNKDYNEVKDKILIFNKYEKTMLKDAKGFYETLSNYYSISRILEKLYVYTHLLFDTDTSDNDSQTLRGKITNLYSDFNKNSYFVGVNILKLEYNHIEEFYNEEPKLKKYEKLIKDEFRYKEHTLSDNEEKLLSSLSKILGNNYDSYELLKDCDLSFGNIIDEDGNTIELTNSNYSIYIESKNREVRKNAFFTLYETFKQYKNTFASLIYNNINEEITIRKIKKYNSSIESSLYKDEIDISVYNNLVETVNSKMDTLYKYYDLKKKILNLEELHLYDIYVPIVTYFDKKYSFDEALTIVKDALNVLGKDYISILEKSITERWIDVYPTKNKRTGGYSSGSYDTYPYILLNYQDKYNDMSTLAHELGHSIHSYYSRKNNEYEYSDYSIFVAEVASTVNELLLSKYMLKHSKQKEEKLFILNNLMELFKATIYRQTMFSEFEKDIYDMAEKNIVLTSDKLNKKYLELNKKYFGNSVVVDEEIQYEWEKIPHLYYNFYVYKYATGLSCACMIVDNILSGKDNAVEKYIEFLKCGNTKNPIESLKVAGVDITKKEVIESAIKMFDDTINAFEELRKK